MKEPVNVPALHAQAHLLIVIQNDDHVLVQEASMVHGLVSHTTCNGPVTNHSNNIVLAALVVTPCCHAQSSTDTGAAVPGSKRVVLALRTLREACSKSGTIGEKSSMACSLQLGKGWNEVVSAQCVWTQREVAIAVSDR